MKEIVTGSNYWEDETALWNLYTFMWDALTSFSEISVASTSYSEQLTISTTFTEV
tara:strand:- start:656 stop:820 length:165 start_codon:yes stop_codon:yes gene_type:complete